MKCSSKAGSDFCVNDNFPGTLAHFHFMILTQERISKYVDACPQNLQLQGVFQMALSMCRIIVEKGL